MSSASFTLSAFGDEIADDLAIQLQTLRNLRIGHLELRGVWGKNVLDLHDEEAATVRRSCTDHGIAVSGVGSPLGKSPLEAPLEADEVKLARLFKIAELLGTRRIRVFSYYPPAENGGASHNYYIAEATTRLARLTELAGRNGFILLLENEKGIVGDIPERCHAILSGIDSPHLRFAWDPANFVQLSINQPTTTGWPRLDKYVSHVHVKDASLNDGTIKLAGEGDGQIGELLIALQDRGYQGFLALEPHLLVAGHSHGFSGADGMSRAVAALRRLMASVGCLETVI